MAALTNKKQTLRIQRNRHVGLKENRTLASHSLDAYWAKGSVVATDCPSYRISVITDLFLLEIMQIAF